MNRPLIGLIVGREGTFPQAFIERVKQLDIDGVRAELVRLGGTRMAEPCPYGCIVDRMSHEVRYYRGYLKNAVLNGTYVINNPFWWSADDKFFNYSLAGTLGVAIPKTVLLPSKSYPADVWPESLRNLVYPLDWDAILHYVGLPAILKPFEGGGWKSVYKIHTKEELWRAYDETGELCMTLQEFIDFEQYVRCFCLGKKELIPTQYDPKARRYLAFEGYLPPDVEEKVLEHTLLINHALGYDMNTVEFAIAGGVPYAIDFLNPAPDMDYYSVTPRFFDAVVDKMARLAIDKALHGVISDMYPRWSGMVGRPK
ncbi:MAG: ATP-grasp domain-containing protein [Acidobacteriota bacterium]